MVTIKELAQSLNRSRPTILNVVRRMKLTTGVVQQESGRGQVIAIFDQDIEKVKTAVSACPRRVRGPNKAKIPAPISTPTQQIGPTEFLATARKFVLLAKSAGVSDFAWDSKTGELDVSYEPRQTTFKL